MFDEMRKRDYNFPISFFDAKYISTYLKIKVGDLEVKNLVLVENHYFEDKKIASFKFTFPFAVPNSTNTWEYVYEIPQIEPEFIDLLKNQKAKNYSDTFFFVNGEIILHNKSVYRFHN